MKRFKTRRKLKIPKIFKILIIIVIIFLLYKAFHLKINFKLNDEFIKYFLNDNNYVSNNNIYKNIISSNPYNKINNPISLLATNFHYKEKEVEQVEIKQEEKPLVYLYNTHQTEAYSMEYMEEYNVTPTVYTAAYMIKERLDKMGLYTIVEDASIPNYLNENNMKYYQSYDASRHYLLQTMEKYDSIIFYLDIHRDAISHEASTININGVECAKIMFVVGKEHDDYLKNLEKTNKLNSMIKEKYPTLTRGVLEKEGKGVNGIYNQDLLDNIMLIEIGGNYNNINEVLNTIDLISPIIGEYINEER